jgi:hypothetical protein
MTQQSQSSSNRPHPSPSSTYLHLSILRLSPWETTTMLGRRALGSSARIPSVFAPHRPSVLPITSAIARRGYATAPGPEPKLNPLSPPIPGELDPRFSDLPAWTVPAINRQKLTETPVEPYYDQQNRRYFGEPVL